MPGLAVAEADPAADAEALAALAGWCLRYAPVVQPDPPDGILIDISGAAHLFGGERGLLADLTRRLRGAGLSVRAALADTPGGAWAMARFGRDAIVPEGAQAPTMEPLPVGALRLQPGLGDELRRLGIERIGQLAAMPRAQVTLRFGAGVVARCDAVLGRAAEPLTPLIPAEIPQASMAFAEPLMDAETLAMAVTRLAHALCRELERRQQGFRLLDAVFRRVDGAPLGTRLGTARASRDPLHCARLVCDRLAEIDPGFGIDEIRLVASRAEDMRERQATGLALDAEEGDEAALAQLIDRLGSRLGPGRIFRAVPVESEYPERAVRRVSALAPITGLSWPARLPRPSRLVDPPESIEAVALAPDHAPALFVWRRQRIQVRHADGPERIRGEWWLADAETDSLRDYYRIEDNGGRRFWIFRDAPMGEGTRWWLHGFFA